jgi:CheY-like chemotaxis protein
MMMKVGSVLFVDDDLDWVDLLQLAFQRAEISEAIWGVENGEEAIRYLKGEGPYANRAAHPQPRLVLLDLRLPGMHGFELLRWIRRQPELAGLPVVAVTGMEAPGDAQRARELGADGFLTKPLLFPKVVEMARKLQATWLRPDHPAGTRQRAEYFS